MTRDRPGSAATAATTVAAAGLVAALLVLVTWAAAIGPDDLVRGDGPATTPRQAQVTETATPTPEPPLLGSDERDLLPDPPARGSVLGVVVLTLGVLALLGGAAVALRRLLRRLRTWLDERETAEPDPEETTFTVLTAEQSAETVAREADRARDALATGTPRNAVVECWARFEAAAAQAGLRRQEWETSAEVVLRFLDSLDADPRAVQELAALYREARFSDHELGEESRRTAARALQAVTGSLRRAAPSTPGTSS